MFRHLDLKNKAFPAYAVFLVIKVCISALISEKISKSYSHVFFNLENGEKKYPFLPDISDFEVVRHGQWRKTLR